MMENKLAYFFLFTFGKTDRINPIKILHEADIVCIYVFYNQVLQVALGFDQPNCYDGRSVIVHLFNWRHTDIALECERFLGPKGYCGVQVSPPSEHIEIRGSGDEYRPWWERYQPVSYVLGTRSGNRDEFADMVNRCESVGVRIYADMVVNHMTGSGGSGTGSAGSGFDAPSLSFPAFGPNDFNCCNAFGAGNCIDGATCYTQGCNIDDYGNPSEVRDCRLVSLVDLAVHLDYTKTTIRAYFDDLINIGVAGFRVDACKHMWPSHLEELYAGMSLPDGSQPFIFNEVIDLGGEPISGSEYFHLGRVTEFKYCNHMYEAFRGYFPLANLADFGESWGMYPSGSALAFVDNHDNQRGHGAGGADILTFWEPKLYKMAVIFTMAHPYGWVRIMSSYRWPGGRFENDGMGPPTNNGDDIKEVSINADESCDDGSDHTWVCEHRWLMIANMAEWRNVAGGEGGGTQNWWSNGNNQIAFSRNGAAFIAFNNEGSDMNESLQTGLPDGEYCNIIASNIEGCTSTVTVSGGSAQISISGSSEDPIVAFHTGPGSLIRRF